MAYLDPKYSPPMESETFRFEMIRVYGDDQVETNSFSINSGELTVEKLYDGFYKWLRSCGFEVDERF